jgi:superfamily II DNA or RNA helicase
MHLHNGLAAIVTSLHDFFTCHEKVVKIRPTTWVTEISLACSLANGGKLAGHALARYLLAQAMIAANSPRSVGGSGKPRILFLSDRNILVDKPKEEDFAPFGDARMKIEGGVANKSRQMYFAIYQSLAKDEHRPGLFQEFGPEFFDLIIIDECHRGSAADDSNWREILDFFQPAYQLGMTATPLRKDNRDTYVYFGDPLYQYSLRQGIEDGFLAPYRVHRIMTTVDAIGWVDEGCDEWDGGHAGTRTPDPAV